MGQRAASYVRLLAAPGRHRRSAERWLVGDRRCGDRRRAGVRAHRRPQERHDPGLRFQRLPERDRGRGQPRMIHALSKLRQE